MRPLARFLLIAFVFVVPWQYLVDFPAPVGNLARVLGLATVFATIPAVLQAGRTRPLARIHLFTFALLVWLTLTYFWSIDPQSTLAKVRGNLQEMMVLWLVWELADTAGDLRNLLRGFVAGSFVLALLTIAATAAPESAGQVRFAPPGQDPNDVARFLDLGFPLAALLLRIDPNRLVRILALIYLPAGLIGVLLTASRGGAAAACVALIGTVVVLARGSKYRVAAAMIGVPVAVAVIASALPSATIERILTIPEQLTGGGDLNQRLSIWAAGAQALAKAPFLGSGAGSFVTAAGLAPSDTAHNTLLAIAVESGIFGLMLAAGILGATVRSARRAPPGLRHAFLGALAVWATTSVVATVQENRTTWVLIALISLGERLKRDCPAAPEFAFVDTETREAKATLQHAQ